MALPEFTREEQYLINTLKSQIASGSNSYMWGYLSSGILLAGFAVYWENLLMLASAFAIVCGFRIYEDRFQSKWTPHWRTIIEKYENAATADVRFDSNGDNATS